MKLLVAVETRRRAKDEDAVRMAMLPDLARGTGVQDGNFDGVDTGFVDEVPQIVGWAGCAGSSRVRHRGNG